MSQKIILREKEMNLSKILTKASESPIEEVIAASAILEEQMAQLKAANEHLKELIVTSKYDLAVSDMVARGKMIAGLGKPEIEIETKLGTKISISLYSAVDPCFSISKELSDKEIIDAVIPAKYKKITTSLDKKQIEADYRAGTLPDFIREKCKESPVEILKTRKSTTH